VLPAGNPPEDFMGYLSVLQKLLGFTQNEIRAILFLSCTFLVGLGLRWFEANSPTDRGPRFDYSVQDSIFAARSARVLAEPQEEGKSRTRKPAKQPARSSIDINAATKDELMSLPGIGESYAERILIYRQDHGPFRSIDDLGKVKGIGKKTLARIREFIKPIIPVTEATGEGK
jgi:comEA protein